MSEQKRDVFKADNLTIVYASVDESNDKAVNLQVMISKEQYDELCKFDSVPDMIDGNTKTKKGKQRPEFLQDKYLVKVSVRDWSTVYKPIELELEDSTILYMVGRKIKLHAIPAPYENKFGKFTPLFAKAIRLYNEIDDTVNDIDKDF